MPLVVPVFIPHQGCPHACIFCNQHRISGRSTEPPVTAERVRETVSAWLARSRPRQAAGVQVAFYGGSFTGLPASRQRELLDAVAPFFRSGQVGAVRLSTRPDYIDGPGIALLQEKGVAVVELGVQSMDSRVLAASRRGHGAEHVRKAAAMLQDAGFRVGLQLMTGLPGETTRSLLTTVREVVKLVPDFVRIYPVLVVEGSVLAELFRQGRYRPLSLGKAVARTAWMKKYFDGHGIKVVRMGLQPGPELENSLVAGPYHPAFGELVRSRLMLLKVRRVLQEMKPERRVRLTISDRDLSVFNGMHAGNIRRLAELDLLDRFDLVTDAGQRRGTLKIR